MSHAPPPRTLGQDSALPVYRLTASEHYTGIVPVFVGTYALHKANGPN